ncbi:uncharacterized protein LOC106758228 [Vigna radiata var. radiata]|uniref:Uncharacterized protein LOC106758228 n=1 Tax=Vigna radiata var. radiata TaxID=3916 RepID=A0A1S3TSF4_VIGRR|nr:uncharacterized protein LOC106758228 [Vigna radiata var. radiata]
MENQGEVQERMKADIQQLKGQMSQILEALSALQSPEGSRAPRPQQRASEVQTFPPYGLPPNYITPSGKDSGHADTQEVKDNAVEVEDKLGVDTAIIHGETIQAGMANMIMTESPEMKFSPYAVTPTDFEKLEMLEKKLRAIEGKDVFEFGDARRLCLVPDVVIPPKFRLPEFEKYRGNTCPRSHITMYCRKMTAYAHDEKLLIHFFQESLTGVALNWYMRLDTTHIHSWKDLVDAFLRQYEYNKDLTPDRVQLQSMVKKEFESFREYAQRWREIDAQVELPLSDKEMTTIFLNTLQPPFYEHMISSVSSNFADIVIIGERVESGIRSGKIAQDPNMVAFLNEYGPRHEKSKERIDNLHFTAYSQMAHSYGSNRTIKQRNHNRNEKVVNFTPIPMTYTKLLPDLLRNNLIKVCPTRSVRPPYPKNYDINARCDYHEGARGHSTETCKALKHKEKGAIGGGVGDAGDAPDRPIGDVAAPVRAAARRRDWEEMLRMAVRGDRHGGGWFDAARGEGLASRVRRGNCVAVAAGATVGWRRRPFALGRGG